MLGQTGSVQPHAKEPVLLLCSWMPLALPQAQAPGSLELLNVAKWFKNALGQLRQEGQSNEKHLPCFVGIHSAKT